MSPVNWARQRHVRVILWVAGTLVVVSFLLSGYAVIRQSQASSERAAEKKAQNTTQASACFQQVRNAPAVRRILGVIDLLASNSIIANQQALAAAPNDDPLRKTRQDSLDRLIPARDDLREFIVRTAEKAPTKPECDKLAAQLGVDPSKLDQP